MKHIPNIITSVRLICAIIIALLALVAPDHGKSCFLPLFVSAAVSDMLDGIIARKFNWCTLFGANLDSISDLSLYLSVSLFLFTTSASAMAAAAPVLCLGFAAQLLHLAFSFKKFQRFPAYHTVYSRVCAYAIFFSVLAFCFWQAQQAIAFIGWLWISTCLEGMAITCALMRPMSNLDSIMTAIASSQRASQSAAG